MLDLAREVYGLAEAGLHELDRQSQSNDSIYLTALAVQIFHQKRSPGEEILELWNKPWYGEPTQLIEFLSRTSPPSSRLILPTKSI